MNLGKEIRMRRVQNDMNGKEFAAKLGHCKIDIFHYQLF